VRAGSIALVLALLLVAALVGSLVHGLTASPDPEEAPEGPEARDEVSEPIRVEVLNGGGAPGAAREATRALRSRGFDVVFFGNAGSFDLDSTVVVDRVDDIERARLVADSLGVSRVRSEPDPELYLDVTVLLGRDWEGRD